MLQVEAPVERKIPNFSKYRLFSREKVKTLNPALLGEGRAKGSDSDSEEF